MKNDKSKSEKKNIALNEGQVKKVEKFNIPKPKIKPKPTNPPSSSKK